MSLHYPQGYRYCSATKAAGTGNSEQGSDSDVAELSDLEDDEDEDGGRQSIVRRVVEEDDEDEDPGDDEDDDEYEEDEEEGDEQPYPGFVPVVLRYLDQTTRPRNWCLALITNPYPFGT